MTGYRIIALLLIAAGLTLVPWYALQDSLRVQVDRKIRRQGLRASADSDSELREGVARFAARIVIGDGWALCTACEHRDGG